MYDINFWLDVGVQAIVIPKTVTLDLKEKPQAGIGENSRLTVILSSLRVQRN